MFFKKKEKTNLERYQDPTGELSTRQLGVSQWFVKNKILLEKIGIGILIAWCVVTVGFSLWKWGDYLIFGYVEDKEMFARQVKETPNYAAIQPLYSARDLQISRPEVFSSGIGKYDFVVDVTNPNERWVAILTYKFTFAGGETETGQTILLPDSKRPVVIFGHEKDSFPTGANFVIEDIAWKQINAHAMPDIEDYIDQRLIFSAENFSFTSARGGQTLSAHHIAFDLKNETVYSYWSPQFYVELLGGLDASNRLGIIPITLSEFRAGDVETIELSSLAEGINVVEVGIYPVINIFDQEEFMEPGE